MHWIKSASQKHGLNFTADDPENLGDEMYDALQYGNDTVEGIVALMHAAAVQATEMMASVEKIEDILGDDYGLSSLRGLVQADVAPVVHAKWDDHHCTACGCQAVTFKNPSGETIYVETPRCPACGAKMDEEQEEPTNGKQYDAE